MIHKTIQLFEDRKDVTLTTYILEDSKEMLDKKLRPAIIINPGGGYMYCSDREAEPIAMAFANMGYHAFVLRYSVGNCECDNCEYTESTLYPTQIIELGKAMLTVRENAQEWFVDVDKIGVCGFSAGGHNASMYCTNWHKDFVCEELNVSSEMLKPAFGILGYAVTDYTLYYADNSDKPSYVKDVFEAMSLLYLGSKTPTQELLEKASATKQVTENTPPMFLWATAEDGLVTVEHTTLMGNALAINKIPFEMHVFEKGGHGLSTATQSSASALDQIDDDASKWLELVDSWLKKRFALQLKERSY